MTTQPLPTGLPIIQKIGRVLVHIATRFEARGLDLFPREGPAIVTVNHVNWVDVPLVGFHIPAGVTIMAAEKWEQHFFLGPVFRHFGNAIFVQRGEVDRRALHGIMGALDQGRIVMLAPEGTRSGQGVLQKAHDGTAWLAGRTGALLTPVAIWGHEHIHSEWKRLHRPRVYLQVGESYRLPEEAARARSRDLPAYTDLIMRKIAVMLPPALRGPYA